ncbi:radical SAM protein [uncultured Eubacterium sp.]|uniref:radical SAM protein n=1 Tax=uncultured Eubacterium sp. TaxID=165185 RepID=UPI0025FF197D|nr:radical SAM protein [uncultured Eubacterium sp.]MCI6536325.1 radical SAM protein [Lachnospiraceae bacterium]
MNKLTDCCLCPRNCHVDRTQGKTGYCGQTSQIRAARAALHMWEEPCISGDAGSGAVFFSGCTLGCVFCQNHSIAAGSVGKTIPTERLAEIFLELQEQKAWNINLVTAGHFAPQVAAALELAKDRGLHIPIVYNTSGYEKVETLRMFDGLVDIYLPDFKYLSSELAGAYSHAEDYPQVAKSALQEMVRQVGSARFEIVSGTNSGEITSELSADVAYSDGTHNASAEKSPEDENADFLKNMEDRFEDSDSENNVLEKMLRGVVVRHLVLPGQTEESKKVICYLYETYGDQIYISIMNQYTPMPGIETRYPELGRKITPQEYDEVVDYAIEIGVENGFIQDGETAEESFIPAFDTSGV